MAGKLVAAPTPVNAVYQRSVGDLLARLCAEYEAGRIEGMLVMLRLPDGSVTTEFAAMTDRAISWGCIQQLLETHLEWVPKE